MTAQLNRNEYERVTMADVEVMLSYIPATDRETWMRVGMALKAEFGDDGFELWDRWSQSSDNYQARACRDVWRSFRGHGVSIGTLVHLAQEHGWRPSAIPATPLLKRSHHKPAPPPLNSRTADYGRTLWDGADRDDEVVSAHPYAVKKGINWAAGAGRGKASGSVIGQSVDCVIVPIRELATGDVQAVQCINPEGKKQTFGPLTGGCLVLGNTLAHGLPWYVCEGWASAVSMAFHHHHGNAVCAAAFGKSQLDNVARGIGEAHQPHEITILREVDA